MNHREPPSPIALPIDGRGGRSCVALADSVPAQVMHISTANLLRFSRLVSLFALLSHILGCLWSGTEARRRRSRAACSCIRSICAATRPIAALHRYAQPGIRRVGQCRGRYCARVQQTALRCAALRCTGFVGTIGPSLGAHLVGVLEADEESVRGLRHCCARMLYSSTGGHCPVSSGAFLEESVDGALRPPQRRRGGLVVLTHARTHIPPIRRWIPCGTALAFCAVDRQESRYSLSAH